MRGREGSYMILHTQKYWIFPYLNVTVEQKTFLRMLFFNIKVHMYCWGGVNHKFYLTHKKPKHFFTLIHRLESRHQPDISMECVSGW